MLHQGENVEEHLIEHARSLQNQTAGRAGLHLHLSKLNPSSRQSYHLRIALNMLTDSIKLYDGELYLLENSDVVFLCKGATTHQLEEIVHKVRYFFSGDPLFADSEDVPDVDDDPFFDWYDLSVQSREFLGACEQLLTDKLQRQTQNWNANETRSENMAPLDPGRLARLRDGLSHTDVSSFMRRQPVCQIVGDETPNALFYELYVRIVDLQRATLPDVDLLANRWLFLHLTEALDDRVLTLLTKYTDEYVSGAISVNFNLDTIFLPKFLTLANRLDPTTRKRIGLEFQLIDVITNLEGFRFARTFLKENGFIVTLDGVNHSVLPDLTGVDFGADLIKVNWDQRAFNGTPAQDKETILAAVDKLGAERLVFTHCSSQAVIEYGQSLGVSMFQGRYVDRIVNPNSRRIN
jgi:EAL domain-containing protein (putative c-di-GMP-specific phosphodiesterase class I)